MKKISFVVLLFVFVCLCGLVTAEAVYEKPILFRGIEWGTSYNEVVETYPNKNQNEWEPGGIDAFFMVVKQHIMGKSVFVYGVASHRG